MVKYHAKIEKALDVLGLQTSTPTPKQRRELNEYSKKHGGFIEKAILRLGSLSKTRKRKGARKAKPKLRKPKRRGKKGKR